MTERKRRGRPNNPLQALPEKNRQLYESFMFVEPVDLFNPQEVEKRIKMYIDYVNQNDVAPLWTDLAFCMGYHRSYLASVKNGTSKTNHPMQTRQLLEQAHLWLEAALAQYGLQHPESSIMVIWLQKNCFGYREPTVSLQIDNGNTALIEEQSPDLEAIKKRLEFVRASVAPVDYEQPKEKALEER